MNEMLEVESLEELVQCYNSFDDENLRFKEVSVTKVGLAGRMAIFTVTFKTLFDSATIFRTCKSFLNLPSVVNKGLDDGFTLSAIEAQGLFSYKYNSCQIICEFISKPTSYTMVKTLPGVVHPIDITGTISATDVELSIDGVRIEGFSEESEINTPSDTNTEVEAEDLVGEYSEFLENDVESPILSAIDLEYAAAIETKKDLAEYASQFEITLKKNRSLKNMLRDFKKISADGEING